jgi:hypothetical protein
MVLPKIHIGSFNNSSYFNDLNYNNNNNNNSDFGFNSDWSKESCQTFLNPALKFYENQRLREKSSRKRCEAVVSVRESKNEKEKEASRLKEYDEKINLNLILKRRRDAATKSTSVASDLKFRYMIIEEITNKSTHCDRCHHRNLKQEETAFNFILDDNTTSSRHQQTKKANQRHYLIQNKTTKLPKLKKNNNDNKKPNQKFDEINKFIRKMKI